MAKKKQNLTPEELLEQALVPEFEWPYEVPENWVWVYLTNGFAECLDRYRSPVNSAERSNRVGDIPYYGATGQVGWIDDFLTEEHLVLVGEDGAPFFDYIKDKAYIIQGKAWVNNHAHILRSYWGENGNKYLMHYLNIFNYVGYVNGTTRLKLTQSSMNKIPIPLPPLAEQKRIVDRIESIFEKLDQAKGLIKDALDSFENRKAAILHKAFSGELTKTWREENGVGMESWEEKTLGQIIKVSSGQGLTSKNMNAEGRVPVYGGNGVTGYHDKSTINMSTIVIGRVGFYCGSIHFIHEPAWVTDNALIVRFDDSQIDIRFLYWLLSHTDLRKNDSSTAQPVISGSKIYPTTVRIPLYSEQQEIVSIIESVLNKEKVAKESCDIVENIDLMKKSILARAFRGELGTNDQKEESALDLLMAVLHER